MLPLYAVRRTVGRVALLFTVKGQQLESMLLAHLSKPWIKYQTSAISNDSFHLPAPPFSSFLTATQLLSPITEDFPH